MPNWKKVIVSGSDASLNSLDVATGITGSSFSGSFTGSLFGTASFAVTASFASTASYALNGGSGLETKAGSVVNTSFGGSPQTASIIFSSAFSNTNYAIVVTGEDPRSWTIESIESGSFKINSNSSIELVGNTYWIATAYGETA